MNLLLLLGGAMASSLDLTAPLPTLSFHGSPGSDGVMGDLSAPLPTLELTGNPVQHGIVSFDLEAPLPTLFFSGYYGQIGSFSGLNAPLPTLSLGGSGGTYIGAWGDLEAPLPTLLLAVSNGVDAAVQEYLLYAMNMKNGAVTQLPYAVDSMCELNGIVYASGPAGIMIFEGSDTNNGADIDARIAKSGINFSTNKLKVITDFFMRCRTQGSMKVTSSSNQVASSVTVGDGVDVLHGFKANLARGVRGSELGIAIENVDGCDFEIAEFEYIVDVSSGRRGK